ERGGGADRKCQGDERQQTRRKRRSQNEARTDPQPAWRVPQTLATPAAASLLLRQDQSPFRLSLLEKLERFVVGGLQAIEAKDPSSESLAGELASQRRLIPDGAHFPAPSRCRERSTHPEEWVSAPSETKSGRNEANRAIELRVMPPDNSTGIRPWIKSRARRMRRGERLSSSTLSAPASSASRRSARVDTSTWMGRGFLRRCIRRARSTEALTPPATRQWLCLMSIPSSR